MTLAQPDHRHQWHIGVRQQVDPETHAWQCPVNVHRHVHELRRTRFGRPVEPSAQHACQRELAVVLELGREAEQSPLRNVDEERIQRELQVGVLADVKLLRVRRQFGRILSKMFGHQTTQRVPRRWQCLTKTIEEPRERLGEPSRIEVVVGHLGERTADNPPGVVHRVARVRSQDGGPRGHLAAHGRRGFDSPARPSRPVRRRCTRARRRGRVGGGERARRPGVESARRRRQRGRAVLIGRRSGCRGARRERADGCRALARRRAGRRPQRSPRR